MRSLAVRRAALVATRAASSSSSSSSSGRSGSSSSRRALSSRSALSSASKSPLASLRQRPFPPSPLSPPLRQHVRCYASRKEEDKSWGEIAGDAAEVAKGALKKLGLGALTAVEKVLGGGGDKSPTPTRQRQQQPQQRPRPGDEGDGGSWGPPQRARRGGDGGGPLAGFPSGGGGLLGGLVGGVLGRAVQGALGAIAEQSREAGALADAALAAASADPRVRDEFGGALSRPAGGNGGFGSMSQSSSTVVVNGRARRSTTVSYPVAGPRGVGGFLEATATSDGGGGGGGGGGAADEVVVRVRSQRGKVIVVDGGGGGGSRGGGGGGGGSGDVIDVDFREV